MKNAEVDLDELQVKDVFQLNVNNRVSFVHSQEANLSPEIQKNTNDKSNSQLIKAPTKIEQNDSSLLNGSREQTLFSTPDKK